MRVVLKKKLNNDIDLSSLLIKVKLRLNFPKQECEKGYAKKKVKKKVPNSESRFNNRLNLFQCPVKVSQNSTERINRNMK